jgi:hypothetical protein
MPMKKRPSDARKHSVYLEDIPLPTPNHDWALSYQDIRWVQAAKNILSEPDQSEEAFLGARLVLMLNNCP